MHIGSKFPQSAVAIAINPNFPPPFRYSLLNAPYFLICSLITIVIITLLA